MLHSNVWTLVLCSMISIVASNVMAGDTLTTKSGLKYIITKKGDGIKPKSGDKIVAHYTGKFTNGQVFDSSVNRGAPFTFVLGKGNVIKGWDEGFALLRVGDEATFVIPYQLGYGLVGRPPKIPAKAKLIFDVQLLKVIEPIVAVPYVVKGLDTLTTVSGLKYQVVREGTGPQPDSGQIVIVHYTGYFLNGKTFDSSIERERPFQFPIGQSKVIKGWDEGISLMKIGGQTRFTIPDSLAYGERGYPNLIPPKTTLIFDIELLNIKSGH